MKFKVTALLWCALTACTPLSQSSLNSDPNPKTLRLADAVYEPQIKTVQLSPEGFPLQSAVTSYGQWNLLLQFDDLRADNDTYYARIVHCNFDWSRSSLQDLDFLTNYNEFPINNWEYSVDTHLQYVHYWFKLPDVKLPGNYVLIIYRAGDREDIVLSRRFLVYDNRVTFTLSENLVGPGAIANVNQQLNFNVNYKNVPVVNPLLDIHAAIRQNQRWDNLAGDVRPTFVREIEKDIEYRFFDESQMFRGGSEFRFFDMRSLNNPGRNVDYVKRNVKPLEVYIARDKSRADEAYSQYDDLNGGFIIDNYDYRDLGFANYAGVTFSLQARKIPGDVFITGAFTNWDLSSENKMEYDSAQGLYLARLLLKQGWYDYQYVVRSPGIAANYFEGSHFETENVYEIFLYHRPFQPQADLLIGYARIEKNPR
jgi:hypothetical protein